MILAKTSLSISLLTLKWTQKRKIIQREKHHHPSLISTCQWIPFDTMRVFISLETKCLLYISHVSFVKCLQQKSYIINNPCYNSMKVQPVYNTVYKRWCSFCTHFYYCYKFAKYNYYFMWDNCCWLRTVKYTFIHTTPVLMLREFQSNQHKQHMD